MEQESFDPFRATVQFFASPGEQGTMTDHFIALAMLRHYGVLKHLLEEVLRFAETMWRDCLSRRSSKRAIG